MPVARSSRSRQAPRRVLVTGGATGIGWGISQAFAAEGASIAIGQISATKAARAVARLRSAGRIAHAVGGDLATAAGAKALVENAVEALGGIDVLVNNAGVAGTAALGPFETFTDDRLDHIIDVNLKGPFRCSREAIAHMPRNGVIVNISSVGAYAAQQHAVAYCASKGGVEMLTRALAIELAERGIRVVGIAPGDIRTARGTSAAGYWEDAKLDRYARINPIGRRGTSADVAGAAVYLASPEASFVTGTTIVVDGGLLAY